MPLPVTEDTPPDMLAGAMDIKVLLPSGRTVSMSVERSTPMMDLLVQLTTVHKLSLAGHTTVALSDSGYPLHHLPSTPLGALDTRIIHVAQRTNTLKRAPLRPNNVQPFTTTFRLQVHLPRNQLYVTRVSPDTRLADILRLACSEKNLDPNKYELRHPANLCECLSLSHTLADYRLQEVTLVASRPPGAPLTPADIMALQREEEKRRQQVKKTGGIYSIIFNKRSKGIPEVSGSVSSDSLNGRSISPARSDESIERSVSPPAPAPPQRPGRKRRLAPKPPAPAPTPTHLQNNSEQMGVDSSKDGSTTLSHSRTSSDSSGYHEASVLSESLDTRTNSSADTLPRRSKLPSTNHIVAKNKSSTLQHGTSNVGNQNLSRSLSNLTAVGINTQNMHSASTSSLTSQGLMPRKKKAAPPPPGAPVKILHDNNNTKNDASKPTKVVAVLLHDIKTFEQNRTILGQDNSNADERLPNSDKNTFKPVQIVPKLDDILDEEDIVLDVTTMKRTSVAKQEMFEQTSMESEQLVTEEDHAPSLDSASSRVEHYATPIISPDLVTSAIVHAPPPAVQELTQSRPKPKPRVLERPQPRPLPRQVPPLKQAEELLPSATSSGTYINETGETEHGMELDKESPSILNMKLKREKYTISKDINSMDRLSPYGSINPTLGVNQTMLVPSNAASSQSSNPNYIATDSVELDNDELQKFEMSTKTATIKCKHEETIHFSDLDFETPLSNTMPQLDLMSFDNGNIINMPQSTTVTAHDMLDRTVHNTTEHKAMNCGQMGEDLTGSATSLLSVEAVNEEPVVSAEALNSLAEMRKNMTKSPASSIVNIVNGGHMGSVISLQTEKSITPKCPNMDGLFSLESPFILGDQDDEEDEGIPPNIESVLRDNTTSTPDIEEVPDWQYHLPAPPSAFRDLHSPTTTEFETVVLADVNVFQEVPLDNQLKQQNKYKPIPEFDHMVHSSTNEIQEDSTQSDCVSNDATSIKSLQNCHSSLSPQNSVDNNNDKYVKENEALVLNSTTVNSESDWEPQTIAVVEHSSRTKLKFNNGDLRLRQDGVTKEVYKVNPIFNNQHYEDDIANKETTIPTKIKSEENSIYKYNHSINRNSNTDLQLSNQLKNFTISTYNKPQSIDSIFSVNQSNETDPIFKKPFSPSSCLPITRTNSYSMMDKDRPVQSVKRSTSYVSLARPYAKPSTFQSISRTKSISSLVRQEESNSSRLRKSTSDANLNQVEDVPLQSLQVLKAILPRLSQSQILYDQSQGTSPTQDLNETIFQDTLINTEIDSKISHLAAHTQENASETAKTETHSSQETKSDELPKLEAHRPFVYRGPPAINFSTWSERPKVQVSLKSDRDYRMGKQSTITNVNTQQTSKETTIINKSSNVNNSSTSVTNNVKKEVTQSKLNVVNNTEERSSKIEPTPLTMRIVSHTPSNYRNNTSLAGNVDQSSQFAKQEKAELQEDRLPIVRAVELKKIHPESFVLRNMSTTHLNGASSNNVANVPVSYHQGTLFNRHSYVEPTFGKITGSLMTNALTKSISTSQINTEEPENSSHQSKHLSNGGKKYTSVIGINGSGAGSAKVIQHSASVQNMQPSIQLPRSQSVRQNFSTVKVNSFSGPKPMPVVKGFRFAGTEAANYDHGPVKISIEPEKSENHSFKHCLKSVATKGTHFDAKGTKQPLKTINGIENLMTKSNIRQPFEAKVQRTTLVTDEVDGRSGNNIPDPPKPPAMVTKKSSQRPVPLFTNPRDELMDAIKKFGGRERLKPSKPKPNSNIVLTI